MGVFPDPQEAERLRKEGIIKSHRETMNDMAQLNRDLAAVGVPPIDELQNGKNRYRQSIPILCEWLFKVPSHHERNYIVSALRVPISKPVAARPLIQFFLNSTDLVPKWEIGHAISCAMDDTVADEVIEIALDRRHDLARMEIVIGLSKLKDPRVENTLISLLSDESVNMGAVSALKRIGTPKARPYLEPFLTHKKAWLRRESKKAIENIDKRSNRPVPAKTPQINRVPVNAPIPTGFEEWSTNCDYEDLEPFLKALSLVIKSGFGKMERQQVLDASDAIEENGVAAFDFPCKYSDQHVSVRVILRIEDDEPDLYLFGPPALIEEFRDKADRVIEKLEEQD